MPTYPRRYGLLHILAPGEMHPDVPAEYFLAAEALGPRYRPSLIELRSRTKSHPMMAVWPDPALTLTGDLAELDGLVLAMVTRQVCFECTTWFTVVYPDNSLERGDVARKTHCPACGAHADSARLHVLDVLPGSVGSM
ncbi:hypothetical protein AB0I28_04205 [Phytomonospora sp. NPDC050363]|uniref:hypothetical protein n=1 Tax=Phytomonospora sp. NPDC050363 TaxID=3155642 RepID=UPI0033CCCF3B